MIDISVLKKYRDYRLIFFSQMISYLGNMVSYVVVPYQVYQISQSSLTVSFLSFVQLAPILVFGLLGGSLADRLNRRKLLISAEFIMAFCSLGLAANAYFGPPKLEIIFTLVFLLQAASAYHRPAMEGIVQKIVPQNEFHSVAGLSALSYSVTAIVGPAFGGWALVSLGVAGAYLFDVLTFVVALVSVFFLADKYDAIRTDVQGNFMADLKLGLDFAYKNKPLFASYLVDIIAMTFAFPIVLFPEIANRFGLNPKIGWLYSGMAIGSLLIIALGAKRFSSISMRGKAITVAAAIWGFGILLYGFSYPFLILSVFCLVLAGAADTVSGLQRRVLWNEIIPNHMRGRLAGIEMISYMAGPLLGNFRSAIVAENYGIQFSIVSGGFLCVILMFGMIYGFPKFWKYTTAQEAAAVTS